MIFPDATPFVSLHSRKPTRNQLSEMTGAEKRDFFIHRRAKTGEKTRCAI